MPGQLQTAWVNAMAGSGSYSIRRDREYFL